MFTGANFRQKAAENFESSKNTDNPSEIRKFELATKSFTHLAQNEDWLAQNFNQLVHSPEPVSRNVTADHLDDSAIAKIEEHILRCLGAAVIMQWNTIPTSFSASFSILRGRWGMSCKPSH
jgi:hypothetical protein